MLLASQGLIDLEGEKKLIVKHINPIDEIARVCTCALIQRFCPCMDHVNGSFSIKEPTIVLGPDRTRTSSATLQISSVSSLSSKW